MINATIYVDDLSRDQLTKGLPIAQSKFSKLGMEVQVRKEISSTGEPKVAFTKPKTECV